MKTLRASSGLIALVLALAFAASAPAFTAGSSDDVCPADDNPCEIRDVVEIVDGSTLDFGTRALNLTGQGRLDFGAGSGRVACGPFVAATDGPAISALQTPGMSSERTIEIEARGTCTAGAPGRACSGNENCQLGACNTRRCSARPDITCMSDDDCQGWCYWFRGFCMLEPFDSCRSDADCNYGTCDPQLTCQNLGPDAVACSGDADCNLGDCGGDAGIRLGGGIAASSEAPPRIVLKAPDSVTISDTVRMDGTSPYSDAGRLEVETPGDIELGGRILARGGGYGLGGELTLTAGQDIRVIAPVNINGGDGSGGVFDASAGRDLHIDASIKASSTAGAGWGGIVFLTADRDITIGGPSVPGVVKVLLNGHIDAEGTPGDGGDFDSLSRGDTTIGANTRVVGIGSQNGGGGGYVSLWADGDLRIDGDITARVCGPQGEGGWFQTTSGGATGFGATSVIDLRGGSGSGGQFYVDADGDIDFAGSTDVTGFGAVDGFATLRAGADATISGTLKVHGEKVAGMLSVEACRIRVEDGAFFRNQVAGGVNELTAHESMTLTAGSDLLAQDGINRLIYRSASKAPVAGGSMSPAAELVVDETLEGCPVCGNAEIDQGETCDDGNTAAGDGCNSDCLAE